MAYKVSVAIRHFNGFRFNLYNVNNTLFEKNIDTLKFKLTMQL